MFEKTVSKREASISHLLLSKWFNFLSYEIIMFMNQQEKSLLLYKPSINLFANIDNLV